MTARSAIARAVRRISSSRSIALRAWSVELDTYADEIDSASRELLEVGNITLQVAKLLRSKALQEQGRCLVRSAGLAERRSTAIRSFAERVDEISKAKAAHDAERLAEELELWQGEAEEPLGIVDMLVDQVEGELTKHCWDLMIKLEEDNPLRNYEDALADDDGEGDE
jgi:hypothetical protein